MKLPIVVYNWGDVSFFSTLEKAEQWLEATDVQNGEYLVFDSAGQILDVSVVPPRRVVVKPVTPESSFASQLRHLLLGLLRYHKAPESGLSQTDLPQLVEMAMRRDPRSR